MAKINVPIRGMHCASCELLIGEQLKKLPGVQGVKVSHRRAVAEISYTGAALKGALIVKAVQEAGYEVGEKEKLPWFSRNLTDYQDLLKAAAIILVLYLAARGLNLFNLNVGSADSGVAVALLVGLIAGVSTCMALVGGLVLGLAARHAELHPEATPAEKFRPHLYFNLGRIVGYAVLGGLIGLIGQALRPSSNVLGILTIAIGLVMIFFGLKLVEIFPALRDKSITLPSGIARFFGLNKEVKEYSHKSALTLGALTFFLPCGFTQAMQLYAVSTGSFWQGAAIMGLFALGTSVGLLGVGGLTAVFKGRRARLFFMAAGIAVLLFGWFNITNGSRLLGGGNTGGGGVIIDPNQPAQEVRMTQNATGYSPNTFTIEKDRPVKWIINSTSSFSCAASIVMPKYGISQSLQAGENIINFTPTATGEIPFSCSMGMYRGKFIVVEPGKSASNTVANTLGIATAQAASVPSGVSCSGSGGGNRNLPSVTGAVESTPVASGTAAAAEQVIKTTYTYAKDIVPNTFTVKVGQPVRLTVEVKENGSGCMSTIMIPGLYNTPEPLKAGSSIVMTFTPTKVGDYPITCAMGVKRGLIHVVN